jgi:hypothetical protein
MNDDKVRFGFLAAAAFNVLGIGLFTEGLTNRVLFETDPAVFSLPGCVLIMVWGLAYAAQARSWRAAPAVSAVFAVEKALFAGWWLVWMAGHAGDLAGIAAKDPLAGAFYGAYGAGDAAFMGFFAWAAWRALG